jgi:hypothetical protein
MSLGLRFGVLLAALALSGGRVLAAGAGQQQSRVLNLALPATAGGPASFSSVLPMTETAFPETGLRRLFDAGFHDPWRRAEACQRLPKLGPSDTAALLYRQYRLQMLNGFIIPHRPVSNSNSAVGSADSVGDSLDIYLLCLQEPPP